MSNAGDDAWAPFARMILAVLMLALAAGFAGGFIAGLLVAPLLHR